MINIFNTDSVGTYGETYPDSGTCNGNRNCVVTGTGIGVGWLRDGAMALPIDLYRLVLMYLGP